MKYPSNTPTFRTILLTLFWLTALSLFVVYAKGCTDRSKPLIHITYNPQQIFLNGSKDITMVMQDGTLKDTGCWLGSGGSRNIEIFYDVPAGEPLIVEHIKTTGSEWIGSDCISFKVHVHKLQDIQGGTQSRGKFGSNPLINLE